MVAMESLLGGGLYSAPSSQLISLFLLFTRTPVDQDSVLLPGASTHYIAFYIHRHEIT